MIVGDFMTVFKHSSFYALYCRHLLKESMADEASTALLGECLENLKITTSDHQKHFGENDGDYQLSSACSAKHSSSLIDLDLNSSTNSLTTDNLMCLQPKQYFGPLGIPVSKCNKKTVKELNNYSLKQLQVLIEDLTRAVEEVSSELVQLLLENDALQQESDARNIAIEQLLKMTVKTTDNELKPVQMSVILPDEDCDDLI